MDYSLVFRLPDVTNVMSMTVSFQVPVPTNTPERPYY